MWMKLGNTRFYKPQTFFVVDQEVHIYFVIQRQACGWFFLNWVVYREWKDILSSLAMPRSSVVTAAWECKAKILRGSGHFFFLCWLPHLSKHQKNKQKPKAVFKPILTSRRWWDARLLHTVSRHSPVLCASLHSLVTGLLCIVNINSMEKVKYLCSDCKI